MDICVLNLNSVNSSFCSTNSLCKLCLRNTSLVPKILDSIYYKKSPHYNQVGKLHTHRVSHFPLIFQEKSGYFTSSRFNILNFYASSINF